MSKATQGIVQDSWETGDSYDRFMGRWSRIVAQKFLEWISPEPGLQWMDIGCGSGALSSQIIHRVEPKSLFAVDQSEGFIQNVRAWLGGKAVYKVGDVLQLPFNDDRVDIVVSGLVLNFIEEKQLHK